MTNISLTPDHQEALLQYELLLESVPTLEQEKEHLLFHAKPGIEAKYLGLVGKHKIELLELQGTVYELKRKLEHIQSCINQ